MIFFQEKPTRKLHRYSPPKGDIPEVAP